MKYTKEQLEGMNNLEINECLHKTLNRWINIGGRATWMLDDDIITQSESGHIAEVNYCKNWNDIMPLAVEHNLTLQNVVGRGGNYWMAGPNTYHHYCDSSPQRAIACCLILVLQEK